MWYIKLIITKNYNCLRTSAIWAIIQEEILKTNDTCFDLSSCLYSGWKGDYIDRQALRSINIFMHWCPFCTESNYEMVQSSLILHSFQICGCRNHFNLLFLFDVVATLIFCLMSLHILQLSQASAPIWFHQ